MDMNDPRHVWLKGLFEHLNEVGVKPINIDETSDWLLLESEDEDEDEDEIDMDSFGDKIR